MVQCSAEARPAGPPPLGRHPVEVAEFFIRFFRDPVGFVDARFRVFGPTYFAMSRGAPLFVTKDPDIALQALVHHAHDFEKRSEDLAPVLGNGLVNANGELWRRQRRLIQPAFQRPRLVTYRKAFQRLALEWVQRRVDGEVVDLQAEMTRLTLCVVAETLFGADVKGRTRLISWLMEAMQNGTNVMIPEWVPTPGRLQLWAAQRPLDALIRHLIRSKRRRPGDDLLSALVTAGGEQGVMSENQLRDEAVTMFAAGHETTALAMTWTLHLLSRFPAHQLRIQSELHGSGSSPESRHLGHCIDEAMRLYPPAYALVRRAVRPTRLGPWSIREGDELVIWVFHMHRDEKHFEAPLQFRPDRWQDAPKNPAYMPFGAGQRACIGIHFARMEANTILQTLLQHVSFEATDAEEVGVRPRITLSPDRRIRLRVRTRPATASV
ncbi:MAG: cytochrome P450 [Myxococcota bacterium]